MEEFNLETLKKIYAEEDLEGYRLKQKPLYKRTKDYIVGHVSNLDEDYLVDGAIVAEKVFNKKVRHFPDEISKWFHKDHDVFKKLVIKFDHQPLKDNEFNLLPQAKHKYKAFNTLPKDIQKKALYFINDYIKPILCNNKADIFDYFTKWMAKMIQGRKNYTMIVLKGPEGCGKSSLTQMICKHILGIKRTFKASSTPLTTKFNIELMAKQFVYFEELRAGNKSEQEMAATTLRELVTGDLANYEAKGKSVLENIQNVSNFMSLSNDYYAIKDNQGRRYFILDIDTSYMDNGAFWSNMYKNLMCDEVGEALYCYFHEIDIKEFKEMDMPITENKISSFIKSYTPTINFIRDNYLFQNKEMNVKTNDLYNEFCLKTDSKYHCKKTYFYDNLKHYGLKFRKTNGYNKYVYTKNELYVVAEKYKWHFQEQAELHDLDDEGYDSGNDECPTVTELKLERLKQSNEIIMNYLKEQCPDHFDNILNLLDGNKDLTSKALTVGTPEKTEPKITEPTKKPLKKRGRPKKTILDDKPNKAKLLDDSIKKSINKRKINLEKVEEKKNKYNEKAKKIVDKSTIQTKDNDKYGFFE